jgi:hypothetical protein
MIANNLINIYITVYIITPVTVELVLSDSHGTPRDLTGAWTVCGQAGAQDSFFSILWFDIEILDLATNLPL